jgi:hypothetical protein
MDETLAELFVCHPSTDDFEVNPMDIFQGVIDDHAYGPNLTPRTIGLYGGRYTIEFRPGEFLRERVLCMLRVGDANSCVCANMCGLQLPCELQRPVGRGVDGGQF